MGNPAPRSLQVLPPSGEYQRRRRSASASQTSASLAQSIFAETEIGGGDAGGDHVAPASWVMRTNPGGLKVVKSDPNAMPCPAAVTQTLRMTTCGKSFTSNPVSAARCHVVPPSCVKNIASGPACSVVPTTRVSRPATTARSRSTASTSRKLGRGYPRSSDCSVQRAPPSVVCRISPTAPTTHPLDRSAKSTALPTGSSGAQWKPPSSEVNVTLPPAANTTGAAPALGVGEGETGSGVAVVAGVTVAVPDGVGTAGSSDPPPSLPHPVSIAASAIRARIPCTPLHDGRRPEIFQRRRS